MNNNSLQPSISFIACHMQSQSHFEQIVLNCVEKIVPAGSLSGLVVKGYHVLISLNIPENQLDEYEHKLKRILMDLDENLELSIYATQEKKPDGKIKYVIAVASGKGGVGKSTVAVNLAFAFSVMGLRVALLDADIYGPSVPHMLGLSNPPSSTDGKKMNPEIVDGVECMSMGLLIPKDQPAIWRGPMVIKAINQMLQQVAWSDRDIMVIDMPPGTGDVQLTLAQNASLSGVVIVSTPQDLALIDARKGLKMFQTLNVPILGLLENMSFFLCPHCGETSHIFHKGGVRQDAVSCGIPFLGEIPLNMVLRESGDSHHPIVQCEPEHDISKIFITIAHTVWQQLNASKNPDSDAALLKAV
ncbi:MAG: P-loop NTPase [Alphaproteobacteria bacterium]|nr:P-loop NTPase [Alphaproteobacteria bacterium]